jgi:hypothetical protein
VFVFSDFAAPEPLCIRRVCGSESTDFALAAIVKSSDDILLHDLEIVAVISVLIILHIRPYETNNKGILGSERHAYISLAANRGNVRLALRAIERSRDKQYG